MRKLIILLILMICGILFSNLFSARENRVVLYSYSPGLIDKESKKNDAESLKRILRIQKKLKEKLEKEMTVIEVVEDSEVETSFSDEEKKKILRAHSARWIIFPSLRYNFDIKKYQVEKMILFDSKAPFTSKEIVEVNFNGSDEVIEDRLLENFILNLSFTEPNVFPVRKSERKLDSFKRVAFLGFKKFEGYSGEYMNYNKTLASWAGLLSGSKIEGIAESYIYPPSEDEFFPDYCKKLNADYVVYGNIHENDDEMEVYLNVYSFKKKSRIYLGHFKNNSKEVILSKIKETLGASLLLLISAENQLFLHQPENIYLAREYPMPLFNGMTSMIPYGMAITQENEIFAAAWFGLVRFNLEGDKREVFLQTEEKKKNAYKVKIDRDGNFYVLDQLAKEVFFVNPKGQIQGNLPMGFNGVNQFAVTSGGMLFIPDPQNKSLHIYKKDQGLIKSIELPSNPVSLNSTGDSVSVLFMDGESYHLYYYGPSGNFIKERRILVQLSLFPYPAAYTEDGDGNIYTIDAVGKTISKINKENRIEWLLMGAFGSIKPFFSSPMEIQVSKDGKRIYLADTMNYRILEYIKNPGIKKASRPETYYQMAIEEKKKNNKDLYFIYLNLALALFPDYVQALTEKGSAAIAAGFYSEAQAVYGKILEKNPEHSGAKEGIKTSLFLSYLDKGKIFEEKFQKALQEIGPESAKKEYEQGIENYEKALQLFPKNSEALALYAGFKEKYQKSSGSFELPKVEIVSLEFADIFSSIYKYYSENSAGKLRIRNSTGKTIDKLWAEVEVKDFMDYSSESRSFRSINSGEIKQIDLFAVFNNNILNITEDTPIHARVKVKYVIDNKEYEVTMQKPFTLYNRNAMTWDNPSKLASFVTPKDSAVKNFARLITQMFRNSRVNFLDRNFQYAVQIFDTLGIYGLAYVPDPKTPFTSFSKSKNQVDYIQYPRDVLKFKTGDCDDLTVSFNALLENIGIETAFVLVPEHILMIFNTGLPESKKADLTSRDELLVFRNGTVWIPVETTMVGKSFLEAWEKGAQKIRKFEKEKQLIILETKEAWQSFTPVTLKDIDWEPSLPSKDMIERLFFQDLNQLIELELKKKLALWNKKLEESPKNPEIMNKIGVVYARYGKYNEAASYFDKAAALKQDYFSPHNNLGNIYLLQKKFDKALSAYLKAAQLSPKDPYVKINLAIVYKNLNEDSKMKERYREAIVIQPSLEKEYAYLLGKEETRAKEDGQNDYFLWTE